MNNAHVERPQESETTTVDSINLDPRFLLIIRKNKHARQNSWKENFYPSRTKPDFIAQVERVFIYTLQKHWC